MLDAIAFDVMLAFDAAAALLRRVADAPAACADMLRLRCAATPLMPRRHRPCRAAMRHDADA